jgi:hypothetical protein
VACALKHRRRHREAFMLRNVALSALASLGLVAGCNADVGTGDNTVNNGLTAGLDVFLSTTNGSNVVSALQELNISVRGVAAHAAGGGWQIVSEDAVVVDLLRLEDSAEALGFANLPEGKITQIRLYVANDDVSHAVDPDGVLVPVVVPSGFETGVKLKGPFDLGDCEYGSAIAVLDLDKSIHIHGRGNHDDLVLRPTIHKTDYAAVDAEFCEPADGGDGGDGPDGDGDGGDDGEDGGDDLECPPNTEGCGGGVGDDNDDDGDGVAGDDGVAGGDGDVDGDGDNDGDGTGDGDGDGVDGDGTLTGDGTGGDIGDGAGGSLDDGSPTGGDDGTGTGSGDEDACAPVLTEAGLVSPCD